MNSTTSIETGELSARSEQPEPPVARPGVGRAASGDAASGTVASGVAASGIAASGTAASGAEGSIQRFCASSQVCMALQTSPLPAPHWPALQLDVAVQKSPSSHEVASSAWLSKHAPSASQLSGSVHSVSPSLPQAVPALTGEHVPTLFCSLQEIQSLGDPPPHAVSQQTPSTQKLVRHCSWLVHGLPIAQRSSKT